VFLPPVTCVLEGSDASLWIGTQRGIARYIAHTADGLSFTTMLEAFPDLTDGPVTSIAEDERGIVWFCTDRGLFRYDGRDMWQFQDGPGGWVQLGRADRLYDPFARERGAWRFERTTETWQRRALDAAVWEDVDLQPRSTPETAVRALAWTDLVSADLGHWDGRQFTPQQPVDPAALQVRFKPEDTRVVVGGLPALPRMSVGSSTWRYLALEPRSDEKDVTERPAWTCEGRLLPPPPGADAPWPGRYDGGGLHAEYEVKLSGAANQSAFDEAVYAFNPAARVWFAWEARRPLTLLARLKARTPGEQIDPTVLDRVWHGLQQVRPAGVRAMLAVENQIVRGRDGS
jgi:hypothetical protein